MKRTLRHQASQRKYTTMKEANRLLARAGLPQLRGGEKAKPAPSRAGSKKPPAKKPASSDTPAKKKKQNQIQRIDSALRRADTKASKLIREFGKEYGVRGADTAATILGAIGYGHGAGRRPRRRRRR